MPANDGRKPELLAPAGGFAAAEAAFLHGADAVYAGVDRFNLRAHSPAFSIEEIGDLIVFSHDRGKRVYIALNIMPDDVSLGEIRALLEQMGRVAACPDAFIVSDPGVMAACREFVPGAELHLSTQTGAFNVETMRFWKNQGVKRVVLPRELTLEQIAVICAAGVCETEVFIHGAMCVSVSGRCLLGAYLDGRHPNSGDCSQPCRLGYTIVPHGSDNEKMQASFEVNEDAGGAHILNSKDLNTIGILDKIIGTGVTALKIEGRNKSLHYVSSVVKVYREAIDESCLKTSSYSLKPAWINELDLLDHRPYTTGFYNGEQKIQAVFGAKENLNIRMVGLAKECTADGRVIIDVRNPFVPGEELNVLPVQRGIAPYPYTAGTLTDMSGRALEKATTNRLVLISPAGMLRSGDILRRILL